MSFVAVFVPTDEEYAAGTGAEAEENIRDSEFQSLHDLVDVSISLFLQAKTCVSCCFLSLKITCFQIQVYECTSSDELSDWFHFIDLLMSLLNVDGTKRVSASQASNHPFITMSRLLDPYDFA